MREKCSQVKWKFVCVPSCNERDFRRFELHAEMRQRQFSNTCASNEAYDINIMRREREREGEQERALRVLEHTFNLLIPISMELNVPRAEDSTSTKQELNGQKQLLLKVL